MQYEECEVILDLCCARCMCIDHKRGWEAKHCDCHPLCTRALAHHQRLSQCNMIDVHDQWQRIISLNN